ncbi:MAG TPA: NAD-dependent epimerase/dehydratase family protein [Bryobacteraceae bacterium]|nr:NAD-dependent epimerase/dehydratase family protein [Bryobacteraceae bacterium]
MKVILFGATGMVGQGVLRECLLDPEVESVLSIGRSASAQQHAQQHPKLRELLRSDLFDYSAVENQLSGYEACFFCLGVSSAGMAEDKYRRITYDLTLAAARCLARLNPNMTFIYVSGMGTDSSMKSRTMWARVKGETENALLQLPFKRAYMFRPGAIVPRHGIKSKTRVYQVFYTLSGPLLPLLYRWFPKYVTTTEQVGRAMLKVAKNGWPKAVLENSGINAL